MIKIGRTKIDDEWRDVYLTCYSELSEFSMHHFYYFIAINYQSEKPIGHFWHSIETLPFSDSKFLGWGINHINELFDDAFREIPFRLIVKENKLKTIAALVKL